MKAREGFGRVTKAIDDSPALLKHGTDDLRRSQDEQASGGVNCRTTWASSFLAWTATSPAFGHALSPRVRQARIRPGPAIPLLGSRTKPIRRPAHPSIWEDFTRTSCLVTQAAMTGGIRRGCPATSPGTGREDAMSVIERFIRVARLGDGSLRGAAGHGHVCGHPAPDLRRSDAEPERLVARFMRALPGLSEAMLRQSAHAVAMRVLMAQHPCPDAEP